MNRKKKVKQTLLKQAKKQRAKNAPSAAKPKYVSKADREAVEADSSAAEQPSEQATE